jgi:hypothetical protein
VLLKVVMVLAMAELVVLVVAATMVVALAVLETPQKHCPHKDLMAVMGGPEAIPLVEVAVVVLGQQVRMVQIRPVEMGALVIFR